MPRVSPVRGGRHGRGAGAVAGVKGQDTTARVAGIPRRPLGKTGIDVTILNQGA